MKNINLTKYSGFAGDVVLGESERVFLENRKARVESRQARKDADEKAARKARAVGAVFSGFLVVMALVVLCFLLFGVRNEADALAPHGGGSRDVGVVGGYAPGQGDEFYVNYDYACEVTWSFADDGSIVSNGGGVIPSGSEVGVDVSDHNGIVNWDAMKDAGVSFAMIRCGYGSDSDYNDDLMFSRNVSECMRLGIPFGVYLYSYAYDRDMAVDEARHVLRLLDGVTPELGVWYDVEDAAQMTAFGDDSSEYAKLVFAFVDEVEGNSDCSCGLYSSLSWLGNEMYDVTHGSNLPIWVACWTHDASGFDEYEYWQAGSIWVDGVGYVDFDVRMQ